MSYSMSHNSSPSNANTRLGRQHSLPVGTAGAEDVKRAREGDKQEVFQADDPAGVATFETVDKGKGEEAEDRLGKSLNGASLSEVKLLSATRPSAPPIRDAEKPRGRASTLAHPILPTLSYCDAAKGSTPVVAPKRPVVKTKPGAVDTFPPLSSAAPKSPSLSVSAPRSYANCVDASICAPVVESPVSVSPTQAKVIRLNISQPREAERNSPAVTSTPSKRRHTATQSATLSPPPRFMNNRARSASVSSIASSRSFASTAPTSTASPATWESEPWYPELVSFARAMAKKSRRSWEKILRTNPKDTSKMKWSEFDGALRALGFETRTRGGSDLEYTPTKFGESAQPISYHRPHPGQEFTLGDLKAKARSFRQQYGGAVAALHEAWDLADTRCWAPGEN